MTTKKMTKATNKPTTTKLSTSKKWIQRNFSNTPKAKFRKRSTISRSSVIWTPTKPTTKTATYGVLYEEDYYFPEYADDFTVSSSAENENSSLDSFNTDSIYLIEELVTGNQSGELMKYFYKNGTEKMELNTVNYIEEKKYFMINTTGGESLLFHNITECQILTLNATTNCSLILIKNDEVAEEKLSEQIHEKTKEFLSTIYKEDSFFISISTIENIQQSQISKLDEEKSKVITSFNDIEGQQFVTNHPVESTNHHESSQFSTSQEKEKYTIITLVKKKEQQISNFTSTVNVFRYFETSQFENNEEKEKTNIITEVKNKVGPILKFSSNISIIRPLKTSQFSIIEKREKPVIITTDMNKVGPINNLSSTVSFFLYLGTNQFITSELKKNTSITRTVEKKERLIFNFTSTISIIRYHETSQYRISEEREKTNIIKTVKKIESPVFNFTSIVSIIRYPKISQFNLSQEKAGANIIKTLTNKEGPISFLTPTVSNICYFKTSHFSSSRVEKNTSLTMAGKKNEEIMAESKLDFLDYFSVVSNNDYNRYNTFNIIENFNLSGLRYTVIQEVSTGGLFKSTNADKTSITSNLVESTNIISFSAELISRPISLTNINTNLFLKTTSLTEIEKFTKIQDIVNKSKLYSDKKKINDISTIYPSENFTVLLDSKTKSLLTMREKLIFYSGKSLKKTDWLSTAEKIQNSSRKLMNLISVEMNASEMTSSALQFNNSSTELGKKIDKEEKSWRDNFWSVIDSFMPANDSLLDDNSSEYRLDKEENYFNSTVIFIQPMLFSISNPSSFDRVLYKFKEISYYLLIVLASIFLLVFFIVTLSYIVWSEKRRKKRRLNREQRRSFRKGKQSQKLEKRRRIREIIKSELL